MGAGPSVTVNVLTFNGERYLDQLLRAVEEQDYAGDVDILVIDSGSTDGTLAILADHPRARLHTIPNSEFGHGRTRNLAAELATGEIVVYLTHDAVPASDSWLRAMVAPMVDDERVAAVFGKQLARAEAPPVLKYDIQRVFERLGPDFGHTLIYDDGLLDGQQAREAAAFYSDVNAAARRHVLLGPVPYRDVTYAEDQQFGLDLLDAGLRKAYAPKAAVLHSNDLSFATLGGRIFDEITGLRTLGRDIPPVRLRHAVLQAIRWTMADAPLIVVDRQYQARSKIGWLLANPWWQLRKWLAYRRATRVAVAPR